MSYEGEKKVLALILRHGETSKSYLQKTLLPMKPRTLDNSIQNLLKMGCITKSNQAVETYQITKHGNWYLHQILENERRSKGRSTEAKVMRC